jgi:hypothetical protein
MVPFKNKFEIEQGIKFSKNGIKQFVEQMVSSENNRSPVNPANSKKWEEKLSTPGIKFFLKKGGS